MVAPFSWHAPHLLSSVLIGWLLLDRWVPLSRGGGGGKRWGLVTDRRVQDTRDRKLTLLSYPLPLLFPPYVKQRCLSLGGGVLSASIPCIIHPSPFFFFFFNSVHILRLNDVVAWAGFHSVITRVAFNLCARVTLHSSIRQLSHHTVIGLRT